MRRSASETIASVVNRCDIAVCTGESDMEFMVPELKKERGSSELDIPELTSWLDGGVEMTEKRKRMR